MDGEGEEIVDETLGGFLLQLSSRRLSLLRASRVYPLFLKLDIEHGSRVSYQLSIDLLFTE